jgi:WD40 repeat protein
MSAGSFEKSRLELVGTLRGHSSSVRSVSFSPDCSKIASGSDDDRTVKLWDVVSADAGGAFF